MSKHTFAGRCLLPCPLRKRSSAGASVCNLAVCSPPQTDSDLHRSLEGSRAASGQPSIRHLVLLRGDPGGGTAAGSSFLNSMAGELPLSCRHRSSVVETQYMARRMLADNNTRSSRHLPPSSKAQSKPAS